MQHCTRDHESLGITRMVSLFPSMSDVSLSRRVTYGGNVHSAIIVMTRLKLNTQNAITDRMHLVRDIYDTFMRDLSSQNSIPVSLRVPQRISDPNILIASLAASVAFKA